MSRSRNVEQVSREDLRPAGLPSSRIGKSADGQGIQFVVPVSTVGDSGPVAVWIVAAQWALAAERVWGKARMLSPEGVFTAEEALARATSPSLAPRRRGAWRRYVPQVGVTAFKDVRDLARARSFRRWVVSTNVEERPAFVWSHHDLFQTAGRSLARHLDVPLVQFVDSLQVWEEMKWGVNRPGWGRMLQRYGELPQLRAADVVACVSERVGDLVKAAGIDPARVVVAPNGVDLDRFHPTVSDKDVRSSLGLGSSFVVGWSGSFRPFHALPTILRAVAKVQAAHPEVALILVGDGQERRQTQAMAAELGLRNVHFTGTVRYEEMPSYVRAMNVALLADDGGPDYHYSPLKLREYMAAGVPVVAPKIGQIAEDLTDGVDSLLIAPGDAHDLSIAIDRLIGDDGLRVRLAGAARAKAERDWSWDSAVARVKEALERPIPRPGP